MFKPIGNMRLCDLTNHYYELEEVIRRIEGLHGNTQDMEWHLIDLVSDEQTRVEEAMRTMNSATYAQVLLINGDQE